MPGSKEIKARIKSVGNTKKITRAMELISTVKMKKAQESVLGSRPLAMSALDLFSRLKDEDIEQFFPVGKWVKKLFLVIASNKGLCGGYNINVFKKVLEQTKAFPGEAIEYVTVGKKAKEFILRTGGTIAMDFSDDFRDAIHFHDVRKISRFLFSSFRSGEYKDIGVIFNYYFSAIRQKSFVRSFLPISRGDIMAFLSEVIHTKDALKKQAWDFLFEPSKKALFEEIFPIILDMMLHEIFLEAKASEHASRMVAMKSAKDNAGKKVFTLTLSYNKARQANITKEVSEIVSGVESMKDF